LREGGDRRNDYWRWDSEKCVVRHDTLSGNFRSGQSFEKSQKTDNGGGKGEKCSSLEKVRGVNGIDRIVD